MARNDFKTFALDPNANVMSQADWEALPALLSGFTSGKASSAQVNKALRQSMFIAAALAQFVSDKSEQDVLDDGDVNGFIAKLASGFAAAYLSRQNPFGDIAADGPAAIATALANLGLGDAVHLADYTSGTNWRRTPDGYIEQWGVAPSTGTSGTVVVKFPIPFPSEFISIQLTDRTNPGPDEINRLSTFGIISGSESLDGIRIITSSASSENPYFRVLGR